MTNGDRSSSGLGSHRPDGLPSGPWARSLASGRVVRHALRSPSGLWLEITNDEASPVTDEFHAGYDRAFVLPDEKETREGFSRCLRLNFSPERGRLTALYGRYVEICVVARTGEDGPMVGGANLAIFAGATDAAVSVVTANLNYVYVDQSARNRGYFKQILADLAWLASNVFEDPPGEATRASGASVTLLFVEQNDPFLLDRATYVRDLSSSGIDPVDRLKVWAHRGARVVDFPYCQPALSVDQEPDDHLVYSVLGAAETSLSAAVLAAHLRAFFGTSVLKGEDAKSDPTVTRQLDTLADMQRRGERIELLDPRPYLELPATSEFAREMAGEIGTQNHHENRRAFRSLLRDEVRQH